MEYSIFIKEFLIVFLLFVEISADYCDPVLCPDGDQHLACNNLGNVSDKCGDNYRILPMTRKRKRFILHLHNSLRNDIALGKINGFETAERMSVLRWDDELEYLAELHSKTCSMSHDPCRNTDEFRYVGQNIGIRITKPKFQTHANSIKNIIDQWFLEHNNANQNFINHYDDHPDPQKKIGHFTTMVSDRSTALGCSCILYTDPAKGAKILLFTCNYSCTNFYEQPVYKTGATASQCELGRSQFYPGLCTYKEEIASVPDPVAPRMIYL